MKKVHVVRLDFPGAGICKEYSGSLILICVLHSPGTAEAVRRHGQQCYDGYHRSCEPPWKTVLGQHRGRGKGNFGLRRMGNWGFRALELWSIAFHFLMISSTGLDSSRNPQTTRKYPAALRTSPCSEHTLPSTAYYCLITGDEGEFGHCVRQGFASTSECF